MWLENNLIKAVLPPLFFCDNFVILILFLTFDYSIEIKSDKKICPCDKDRFLLLFFFNISAIQLMLKLNNGKYRNLHKHDFS